MHEGRRPFVHLFSYHLKAGRIRRGQGPDSARKATEDSGRRSQREGFWSMGRGWNRQVARGAGLRYTRAKDLV